MKIPLGFQKSLAARIVLPFAVALVAVFGAASAYLGHTVREEGIRELMERGKLVADTLAYNAELPLLARDVPSINALLEGAGSSSDLLEAAVFDAEGRMLASFAPQGSAGAPARAAGPSPLIVESAVTTEGAAARSQEASTFAMDALPGAPRQRIGRVRLLISPLRSAARTRRLEGQIAAAGAGLLLLCVAISLGVVRVIGAPLRALVAATRRVAAGDLSVRVVPSSADEVGEVGRAFNRMAGDLEVARTEVLAERAELERRVHERTAELQRAQESLIQSEKMNAVGQLVAGVAHELNNPLTVVLGYAGLLLQQSEDPSVRRKLEVMAGEAERSRKIVQNLLTFARKQKNEQARVSLNEVVTRTVGLRAYDLRNANVRIDTDLDPSLPATWADFHQLQQVLLNLLVNAEQAIHDAGKGSRLAISSKRVGDRIEIVVEDDGPGVSPENRARLFEPFFTTKPVGRGTGLGLSICYGIIADHGGTIRVDSDPGRFTRFTISLPVRTAPPAVGEPTQQEQEPAAPADPGAAPRRILVIDDDPAVLQFVADAFAGLSFAIETAHGGRDGIARLGGGRRYDLILSDVRMPEVDGRAVFRYVRENRPELMEKLVFATGDVASTESTEFLQHTGRPVLEKPFSVEALRDAVSRLLN